MESSFSVENEMGNLQETPKTRKKGGFITLPSIIANEAFEKVSSYGILPNMIFYLLKDYGMSLNNASHVLYLWSAGTHFTPTIGAFLADSYLGRYLTIVIGCFFSLMGVILVWLTAMIPNVRPPPCNIYAPPCVSATSSQLGFLVSGFIVMSIGAGGIRSSSIAFGADQINPNNQKALETFFSWYYVSGAVSVLIAVTGIVYIQDHSGWKVGFGIPVILMFLSGLFFILSSAFYVKRPVGRSVFTDLYQVIVVAIKNRKLDLPPLDSGRYHTQKGSGYTVPTDRLRFLNKACIIRSPEDVTSDGVAANPWSLCTIEQVEDLKKLIRILPIWSTGILIQIIINQTFPGLQANSMNRHLTPKFQIPPGSIIVFLIISLTCWMSIYDRVLLPLASKIKGRQVKISPKIRMGIGLVMSTAALAIAATVEHIRRTKAIKQGLQNNLTGVVDMSVFWLFPQFILYGIADAFNSVGQIEFYYSQLPRTMSSIAASMFQLGVAVAFMLASALLSLVEMCTKGKGGVNESWVSNNINKGHYDYYYWLLCIFSVVNFFYFLICCWAYGPSSVNQNAIQNVDELQIPNKPDPPSSTVQDS